MRGLTGVLGVVRQAFRSSIHQDGGQGMLEYGLIIALVALLVIGVLIAMNGGLQAVFNRITTCLNDAVSGTGC